MKRTFGEIPGINIGAIYKSRKDAAAAGIHRPLVKGISGSQIEGADSISISGGYEDDLDLGDEIIYTGEGGQENGKQVKDQELSGGNLALAVSELQGLPVRVLRGAHKGNSYAPKIGYRYDGLYRVDSHWHEIGKAGFKVWRFRLLKLGAGDASDGHETQDIFSFPAGRVKPKRIALSVQRVIRDSGLGRAIKRLYEYKCQVCGIQIATPSGFYAEAAHIRPVGLPHDGPDIAQNLLCLCPNHHLMFDKGVFAIDSDLKLIGIPGELNVHKDHQVAMEFIEYHRKIFTEF